MDRFYICLLIALFSIPVMASGGETGSITGKVEAKPSRFGENSVVYIKSVESEFSVPDKIVMDQKELAFVPQVLPVVEGTTVDFQNSDDVLHNVFTPDKCADRFNLGSWPKGEVRSYTFDKAGCVPVVLCNVHPEMEAFIVVLQNPYYAVADKDGRFTIDKVPPGTYTLNVWNKRLRAESQEVTVTGGNSVEVTFTLKR